MIPQKMVFLGLAVLAAGACTPRRSLGAADTAEAVEPVAAQDVAEKPVVARTEAVDVAAGDGDNSARNRVDAEREEREGKAEVTADDQSNSQSDVETTRLIRRSLTSDGSLSTYAHNIKIITENGRVVLKGPVRTATEKEIVEGRARKIAGMSAVTSELTVEGH